MISLLICAFLFKGSLCYDDGYGTYGPPGAPSPIGGAPGSDQVGQLNSGFFQTGWKSQYTGPYYFKGQNNGPKISIRATVSFQNGRNNGPFPDGSCLRLRLEDNSRMDAPAIVHYEEYIDLSRKSLTNPFIINVNKPERFFHHFHVTSIINVGWCAKGTSEWIKKGDYLDDPAVPIVATNSVDDYTSDLRLKHYNH